MSAESRKWTLRCLQPPTITVPPSASSSSSSSSTPIIHPAPEAALLCRFADGTPLPLTRHLAHGSLSSSADLERQLTFTLHSHREPRKAMAQRILEVNSERIEWAGKNYLDESYKLNPVTFAIGLVRPQQQRVDLVPVNHVYLLRQRIKPLSSQTIISEEEEAERKAQHQTPAESYAAQRKQLVDHFGSKKRKSQLASRESNQVVMNDEIGQVLEGAVSQVSSSAVEQIDSEQDLIAQTKAPILPPYNADTDDVKDIFALHDMIPEEILNALKPAARNLLRQALHVEELEKSLQAFTISSFVRDQLKTKLLLHASIRAADDSHILETTCILLVVYALIALKIGRTRAPYQALKALTPKLPDSVYDHLLNAFAVSSVGTSGYTNYQIDTEKSRKLLSYMCLLSLHVNAFKLVSLDVQHLSTDLRMTATEFVTWCRGIGCTKATKTAVQLTAPLSLGKFKRKRKPLA